MQFISVVSPVYNSEKIIPFLVERLNNVLAKISHNYEIILVDDSSVDASWDEIAALAEKDHRIKGIRFSRNFGQHYAISAGLDYAIGDWVVVLDCDLQDQPEEIENLYKKAIDGDFDVVLASRKNRNDAFLKRIYSVLFYKVLSFLTGTKHDSTVANFGIYNKIVIDEVKRLRESIRYFPTMVKWVGFRKTTLVVQHSERFQGRSGYNFKRMINLALDIILAYSDKPIRIAIKFGIIISPISFLMSLYTLYKWYINQINVIGYSSLIISIWFLSGCILTTMGVIGLYVGKTFEGVKNRPIYIIKNTKNV